MEISKVIKFKFDGLKCVVTIDSDGDGQPVFLGTLDLTEAATEALALLKGKPEAKEGV